MAEGSSLLGAIVGGLLALCAWAAPALGADEPSELRAEASGVQDGASVEAAEGDTEELPLLNEELGGEADERAEALSAESTSTAEPGHGEQSATTSTKDATEQASALTKEPGDRGKSIDEAPVHIEEEDGWAQWPLDTSTTPLREDFPSSRWTSIGGFAGSVYRPSKSDEIVYRRGVAYGGYVRPEITSWLAVRLFYRQENIPVDVEPGGYDYKGSSTGLDFEQPNLEVINVGLRVEPMWVVHPQLRVYGVLGWSWLGFRALMPTAPGFNEQAEDMKPVRGARSGVETNITLGAGVTIDLIKNWLELGVGASYSISASQTGSAYEAPLQVIVDGEIAYLKALPKFGNSTEILLNLGLIL